MVLGVSAAALTAFSMTEGTGLGKIEAGAGVDGRIFVAFEHSFCKREFEFASLPDICDLVDISDVVWVTKFAAVVALINEWEPEDAVVVADADVIIAVVVVVLIVDFVMCVDGRVVTFRSIPFDGVAESSTGCACGKGLSLGR